MHISSQEHVCLVKLTASRILHLEDIFINTSRDRTPFLEINIASTNDFFWTYHSNFPTFFEVVILIYTCYLIFDGMLIHIQFAVHLMMTTYQHFDFFEFFFLDFIHWTADNSKPMHFATQYCSLRLAIISSPT